MASSSSTSSVQKSFKYDVFLSFRGEDTRNTFVDHLYHALQQKSIHTYKDDERIKKGERICDELIKSIEDSKIYIIVFSRNYASSSWCLDELVKIIECQKTTSEHTAYPVFYDVEPTEVRKQSGEFGKAFAKQEKEEAAEKWREALKEAANLSGFGLKNTVDGHEAKFIQKIVEEISLELRSINVDIDEKLVGMEARIKGVVSSLEMGFDDVRMIGMEVLGGAGKTTLARAVFNQISIQFEGKSFVENVREISKGSFSGLKSLQEKILSNVLNDKNITVDSVHEGKKVMKKRMCCIKVLVVLDDVDNKHQLEALAGERNWFKPGSRIIITTRDEQPLVAHGINSILYASLLSNREALCLFSRYAFGKEIPIQGYAELSNQVVLYAAGLPLALTVLGSFLCGKNELEWENAIQRLKTILSKDTFDILEISYNGLEEDHKEIFLDVACIFKGFHKGNAIKALESCGFYATIGLRVLEQKSLITISEYGYLHMHASIVEMARNIVRRSHPDEPNKHSRLWIEEETKDILATNQVTNEATRCIKLQMREPIPEYVLKGLGYMKKLRFLQVSSPSSHGDWKFDQVSQYFSNSLRYMSWENYPYLSLPKTFQANNLVGLQMHHSRIVQLWEGGESKDLKRLRFLDLNSSMLKTLDLRKSLNLEKLNLARCHDLVELQMPLIGCRRLTTVNLSHSKLRTLDLGQIPNLQTLNLGNCHELVELHVPVGGLKSLEMLWLSGCFDFTKFSFKKKSRSLDLSYREKGSLMELHLSAEFLTDICPIHPDNDQPMFQFTCFFEKLSIGNLENHSIGLRACSGLESLSGRICGLQCVTKLTLSGSIQEAPKDLGRLECLEELKLSLTNITHLPDSICMLKHLKILRLKDCQLLEKLPEDLNGLECLEVLCLLRCIKLRDIPKSICRMKHLKRFDLNGCTQIEKLPEELGCIACLSELYIEGTGIGDLPLSIVLLEGLHIKGSELLHQSCTPTFDTEDSEYNTFYHRGTRSRSLLHDPDF